MTVFRLDERIEFPPPELADDDGLLAVGGDLRPERLLAAYSLGIFPWYSEGLPILWHSPDPRMVLRVDRLHVPRSLAKAIRRETFEIRFDTAFRAVIERCARAPRVGQDSTWITRDMLDAYGRLHDLGFAHSIEAYQGGQLVGGLYGVALGRAFFGESMYTDEPEASKIAFVTLVRALAEWEFSLIDCQVYTEHLSRFGAEMWSRGDFLAALELALDAPTRRGKWVNPAAPPSAPDPAE